MNARNLTIKFCREWQKKYGYPYKVSWGKDGKIFKRLLDIYPATQIESLILLYLRGDSDPFVCTVGHTVGVFETRIPALLADLARREKSRPDVASDFERLEEARRRLNETK